MSDQVFLPGSTIGILGSGQLARMMSQAAMPLGFKVVAWSGGADSSAVEREVDLVSDGWQQLLDDVIVVQVEKLAVLGKLIDDAESRLAQLLELVALTLV